MNQVGFSRSCMNEERRIAIFPEEVRKLKHPNFLFFEMGYGGDYGYRDSDYSNAGAHICSKEKSYNLEVICQPKFCEEDLRYLKRINQIVFGWLHLLEDDDPITRKLVRKKDTAFAWEYMFREDGTHVFSRNNMLTGKIGVLHSIAYAGKIPEECSIAVIGKGHVGKGAIDELERLGIKDIHIFGRKNIGELKENISNYDVIFHCAPYSHEDILSRKDLRQMKDGALFVHLGGNSIGGSPEAQSIFIPTTQINGRRNLFYRVNHIPTLAYKTASQYISEDVSPYINQLVLGEFDDVLLNSAVVLNGKIIRERM